MAGEEPRRNPTTAPVRTRGAPKGKSADDSLSFTPPLLKPPNSFFLNPVFSLMITHLFFAFCSELLHASQVGLYRLRKNVKLLLFEACFSSQ